MKDRYASEEHDHGKRIHTFQLLGGFEHPIRPTGMDGCLKIILEF
jgi:hypothetical protein